MRWFTQGETDASDAAMIAMLESQVEFWKGTSRRWERRAKENRDAYDELRRKLVTPETTGGGVT